MQEKDLICKIKELRKIKPTQDWAVFTKERILGETSQTRTWISVLEFLPRLAYKHNKLAFASFIVFALVAGAFGFAQNSLPGDPIFILKKITEKSREALTSEQDLARVQLGFANKRLEELNEIARTNQVKKMAPAIQEFQTNVSKAAENLSRAKNPNVKEIVLETKKIMESKERVEALGVVIGGTENLDSAILELLEREIKDLQVRTLTEEQQNIFREAVKDFEDGNYAGALEKIILLTNPQD